MASKSTLYLGAASSTPDVFTVPASKTLFIGKTAVESTDAVNKGVLDASVTALTAIINQITGSTFQLTGAFDTLPEILIAVNANASAITAEASARIAAAVAEHTARVAAEAAEHDLRVAAEFALQIQISDTVIVPLTPAIVPNNDGAYPPALLPSALVNAGHQGWYYKNIAKGNKINWYMQNMLSGVSKMNFTVGDIYELNIPVTLISKASTPFITIYTVPLNPASAFVKDAYLNDPSKDASSWYHSKRTYCVDGDGAIGHKNDGASLVDGEQYLFRANVSGSSLTANCLSYSNIDLLPSVVTNSTQGVFSNNEVVKFISIGTNSGAEANTVEFVVKHFEIRTSKGNKKMLFSNDTVRLEGLFQALYGKSDPVL